MWLLSASWLNMYATWFLDFFEGEGGLEGLPYEGECKWKCVHGFDFQDLLTLFSYTIISWFKQLSSPFLEMRKVILDWKCDFFPNSSNRLDLLSWTWTQKPGTNLSFSHPVFLRMVLKKHTLDIYVSLPFSCPFLWTESLFHK